MCSTSRSEPGGGLARVAASARFRLAGSTAVPAAIPDSAVAVVSRRRRVSWGGAAGGGGGAGGGGIGAAGGIGRGGPGPGRARPAGQVPAQARDDQGYQALDDDDRPRRAA